MSINDFLREKIKELAFISPEDSDSLLKSRSLDSITVVDLAVMIEQQYEVKIPFTEITEENFESISSIAEYLKSKGILS